MNMTGRFTEGAKKVLDNALLSARTLGHSYIGSEHLLMGLLTQKDCISSRLMSERGLTQDKLRTQIIRMSGLGTETSVTLNDMTPRCRKLLKRAAQEADDMRHDSISSEHIFMAILGEDCVASQLLAQNQIKRSELYIMLDGILIKGRYDMQGTKPRYEDKAVLLQKHGRDLTLLASQGKLDPVIGRQKEEERVLRILLRRTKNNPLLLGEAGVGKTAIAEQIAMRIASGNVPERLACMRVFSLDMSTLVAGTKYRGEFEDKMKSILSEIRQDGEIILFIDEIHTLVGAGAAEGAIDASNIFKPALARGELQLIGATTLDEYKKSIEHDGALARRFQCVSVHEPTPEGCLEILEGLKERYEQHHEVVFSGEALKSAVELSVRYIPERRLPDKAIDLMDEAAARKSLCTDEDRTITALDIAATVELITGIPVIASKEESLRLMRLEAELGRQIVGQADAIHAIAEAIRRSRAGIGDDTRPIGSFLFSGESGVGKTETAKVLSKVLFGDGSLIRLDMSEYSDKISASKLIGSPPGYAGYGEGGTLTEFVKHRPYSVVLFDEIEKAAPEVVSLLLQILDEASLTDSLGRAVSFSNTVIILTTNQILKKSSMGFSSSGNAAISSIIPQELLNRIDERIRFNPLTHQALRQIAQLQLSKLSERLGQKGILFEYSDNLCASLADECEQAHGARDLRSEIRRKVEQPIASGILSGKIQSGDKVKL